MSFGFGRAINSQSSLFCISGCESRSLRYAIAKPKVCERGLAIKIKIQNGAEAIRT